jgi:hypothetical protein
MHAAEIVETPAVALIGALNSLNAARSRGTPAIEIEKPRLLRRRQFARRLAKPFRRLGWTGGNASPFW